MDKITTNLERNFVSAVPVFVNGDIQQAFIESVQNFAIICLYKPNGKVRMIVGGSMLSEKLEIFYQTKTSK